MPPRFPIERQKPILTMAKPLIIECGCPGWLPLKVNPYIPFKPEELTRELVESIKAGASIVHVHPRNPLDGYRDPSPLNVKLRRTLDPLFEQCPDIVTWNHAIEELEVGRNYTKHIEALLSIEGGRKYIQGVNVLISARHIVTDTDNLKEGIQFMEKNGVKPIFHFYDTYAIEWFRDEVMESGLAKWKPYNINLQMGKHDTTFIGADPWGHLELLTCFNTIKAVIPDSIIGVYAGGRNWLPITVTAITLGADVVRAGVEDALWIYPHRDDIIKKNSDMISKIATIARELGREVATPDQVRQICKLS